MSLSAGIVGLPNVGKSTIFNALTAAGAESANYPFCTIDPNTGIVPVPDERLQVIARHLPNRRIVPAVIEIMDIAGLVRGASRGEGLGNQFLGHIRQVDAILHVVRCFESEEVVHVSGSINPIRDVEEINLELVLADLESAERQIERNETAARLKDPEAMKRLAVLEPIAQALREGRLARSVTEGMSEVQQKLAWSLGFITVKPVLYVANVDEKDPQGENNPHVDRLQEWLEAQGEAMVILSGEIEAEIGALDSAEEKQAFLEDLGLEEPGLAKLARATYKLLGLQSYFTWNEEEIRAWPVPVGATAPEAAGVIHSDFERGFIRAEAFSIKALEQHGSVSAIRAAGKMRSEGKEYRVRDGDILHFLFNV